MKLLVVSDSHGLTSELVDLKKEYQHKVDAMIHCGDSELPADSDEMQGFMSVRGNCDYDRSYPLDITENIKGNTIFVTHGHHYNVKMTLMNLSYKAKEVGADFVFFGHSHALGAEIIDGTLFLNPGSIFMPRGRLEKTYAIIEKVENQITTKFYASNHQELLPLRHQFVL